MAKVLLIETDKFLAKNVTNILEANDFIVDWQVDPQAAVISLDQGTTDLIIMDLVLAGRSGIEFLYEIRSYPDWQKIPVIAFSSVPEAELGSCAQSLEQLDVKVYYHKPATTVADLVRAAKKCLQPAHA